MQNNSAKTVLVPFPVTICPPACAEGALPFHLDPIDDFRDIDPSACCEDDVEVSTSVEGDGREADDVFFSRPLRLR